MIVARREAGTPVRVVSADTAVSLTGDDVSISRTPSRTSRRQIAEPRVVQVWADSGRRRPDRTL
jgi:hypothetical protein